MSKRRFTFRFPHLTSGQHHFVELGLWHGCAAFLGQVAKRDGIVAATKFKEGLIAEMKNLDVAHSSIEDEAEALRVLVDIMARLPVDFDFRVA